MSFRCESCGVVREQSEMKCAMLEKNVTMCHFYRFCADKESCLQKLKETARNKYGYSYIKIDGVEYRTDL